MLFITGGLAEFSNKLFQKYGLSEQKEVFLFFVFFTAFVVSLFFTLKSAKKLRKRDVITGFAVGIPNLFSSFFIILSLKYLKTSVVFPVYSAGAIVVISIMSFLIFKEKLGKRERIAILLTIAALILVNLD